MTELIDAATGLLEQLRSERPLVHLITNLVTMNDVANAVLAVGARPVMALSPDDVGDITRSARALVLNLGTPTRERVEAMKRAGQVANERRLPIVFDPVGFGASGYRQNVAMQLLTTLHMAIVRGNAGEIAALAGMMGATSGVDSILSQYDRPRVVKALANKHRAVIVATGEADYASDGKRTIVVENGHAWLTRIAGAGDMLTGIIGAAAALGQDRLDAAVSGLLWMGIAAERAAEQASGVGSLRVALLDELDGLNPDTIRQQARFRDVTGG